MISVANKKLTASTLEDDDNFRNDRPDCNVDLMDPEAATSLQSMRKRASAAKYRY